MNDRCLFRRELLRIALPITLQCLLQSSFGVVDQIMTGQLGSISIAGIGLAGKFTSLFSVLISAIMAAAGIMIAQYIGNEDERQVSRSFFINFGLAAMITIFFMGVSLIFPVKLMGVYTKDNETVTVAAQYLKIFSLSFLPLTANMMLSTFLRCVQAASVPLYTSAIAAAANTGLNYALIFGKFGFPQMGYRGAAWASVIAQVIGCLLLFLIFIKMYRKRGWKLTIASVRMDDEESGSRKSYLFWWKQYVGIILPILVCEFFWSLGENVYAGIYGHIGTGAFAAMTLTNPVQAITIGALSGVSQAAGIMIGKTLGAGEYEKAYKDGKKLMWYGFTGSLLLSILLLLCSRYYVRIFNVEDSVRKMAESLLLVYALVSPVKVQNMILGGGIIRSGGKTNYVMVIDLIGTWLFGVPLGLMAAFVWHMPIAAVYFILSMEECVRLGISIAVYRSKKWMQSLE